MTCWCRKSVPISLERCYLKPWVRLISARKLTERLFSLSRIANGSTVIFFTAGMMSIFLTRATLSAMPSEAIMYVRSIGLVIFAGAGLLWLAQHWLCRIDGVWWMIVRTSRRTVTVHLLFPPPPNNLFHTLHSFVTLIAAQEKMLRFTGVWEIKIVSPLLLDDSQDSPVPSERKIQRLKRSLHPVLSPSCAIHKTEIEFLNWQNSLLGRCKFPVWREQFPRHAYPRIPAAGLSIMLH